MRIKEYTVVNNRFLFRCPHCSAKRSFGVLGHVRKRSVRCHKCGAVTTCKLNRRQIQRISHQGKCIMISEQGKEFDILLSDVSSHGLGFDIPFNAVKHISINQRIKFKCTWNPRLLGNNYYIVRSIKGFRVGAEKIV